MESLNELIKMSENEWEMRRLLSNLRIGRPVSLLVLDPQMRRKKRVPNPILFITPTKVYGHPSGNLVFALQGGGCEVMPITKLDHTLLYRMGLTMKASKLLCSALSNVLLGQPFTP